MAVAYDGIDRKVADEEEGIERFLVAMHEGLAIFSSDDFPTHGDEVLGGLDDFQ